MTHTTQRAARASLVGAGVAALVATGIGTAAPASAEERVCRGTIGAVTVDNLRVPQGATCRLEGTLVQGTVTIATDARLFASRIRVVGNIQGEGHARANVRDSRIGGSIQLVQGEAAVLRANRVGQDVQSFQNTAAQDFTANRINGNLQCKENTPAPTGSGNVVQGNKEDQCSGL